MDRKIHPTGMFRTALLSPLLLYVLQASTQSTYFPPATGTWESTPIEETGWCADEVPALYDYLDSIESKAFIVLKDGKIVLERYFDNFTEDSIWVWNSAGKGLTAFLVGRAQAEGLLDIDDQTSDYLGEGWTNMSAAREDLITVWHQLSMTTGMNDLFFACTSPWCLFYVADAGTRWSYHNGPYTLLRDVVEAASGIDYNSYTNSRVLGPTGMTGLWVESGDFNIFVSNARSMARFGLLVSQQGNWDGTELLGDTTYWREMISPSQEINESYGYLWWLNGQDSYMLPASQIVFPGSIAPAAPASMYSALGKDGQFLDILPEQGVIAIRMGESVDGGLTASELHPEYWERLSKVILCDAPTGLESPESPSINIPNPIPELLRLQGQGEARIFNASGQLIWSGSLPASIPTSNWNAGIYLLQIQEGVNNRSRKLVLY